MIDEEHILLSLAHKADVYVHKVLSIGSSNRSLQKGLADQVMFKLTRKIDQLNVGIESLDSNGVVFSKLDSSSVTKEDIDQYHSQIAHLTKQYKAGNCLHMVAVAYDYFKQLRIQIKQPIKIEVLYFLKYDHAVLRLSLNGKSIIFDPWDSDAYAEKQLKKKMFTILSNKKVMILDNDTSEQADITGKAMKDLNLNFISVCESSVGKETDFSFYLQKNCCQFFKFAAPVLLFSLTAAALYTSDSFNKQM